MVARKSRGAFILHRYFLGERAKTIFLIAYKTIVTQHVKLNMTYLKPETYLTIHVEKCIKQYAHYYYCCYYYYLNEKMRSILNFGINYALHDLLN